MITPADQELNSTHNFTWDEGFGNGTVQQPEQAASVGVLIVYYCWTYGAPAIFALIFVVGVIGNSMVIHVILSKPSMRTVTNLLLLNLAVADITFLVICIPFTAHKFMTFVWIFGDAACKIVQYFVYVTTYVTIYTLVSISALRYLTVVWGVQTLKWRTRRNAVLLIVCLWMITFSVNIPILLKHKIKTIDRFSYCGLENSWITPVFIVFFVTSYALPLAAVCFLYMLILCHLRRQKSSMIDQSRDRTSHAFRVIVAVVVVFALSWLPHHANSLAGLFGTLPNGAWYSVLRVVWYCMAYGNSCANPLIYNYGSQEFRKSFRESICCKYFTRTNQETGTVAETMAMV